MISFFGEETFTHKAPAYLGKSIIEQVVADLAAPADPSFIQEVTAVPVAFTKEHFQFKGVTWNKEAILTAKDWNVKGHGGPLNTEDILLVSFIVRGGGSRADAMAMIEAKDLLPATIDLVLAVPHPDFPEVVRNLAKLSNHIEFHVTDTDLNSAVYVFSKTLTEEEKASGEWMPLAELLPQTP